MNVTRQKAFATSRSLKVLYDLCNNLHNETKKIDPLLAYDMD